jgi:hypothetical protein
MLCPSTKLLQKVKVFLRVGRYPVINSSIVMQFEGAKTVQSRGCSLCDVRGGNIIIMPVSWAFLITGTLKRVS